MSAPTSNIRVFVEWSEQTVFAGEDVECQITFKNTEAIPSVSRDSLQVSRLNGFTPGGERQRKNGPFQTSSVPASRPPLASRGHRSSLSLTVPANGTPFHTHRSRAWDVSETGAEEHGHRRSVSIISLGLSESTSDNIASHTKFGEGFRKPSKGHFRTTSLQAVHRRTSANGASPPPAPTVYRSTTQPSRLFHTYSTSDASHIPNDFSPPGRYHGRKTGVSTVSATPALQVTRSGRPLAQTTHIQNFTFPGAFKFPALTPPLTEDPSPDTSVQESSNVSPHTSLSSGRFLSPRPGTDIPTVMERAISATRVLSPTISETPRSSGEFYTLSNNSTETLASEYLPQQHSRSQARMPHVRQSSSFALGNQPRQPETLMMGYAQINGSFTIDGSLINQAPFEEVKRKGAVGGQGGGVVGFEPSKRDSGLLGGFGWSSIGNSLGGLLGAGELSSIKDMRAVASSKAVPLLATPQSILFIDLKLAPGESKTFGYTFRLPRGLPPTHRGKAFKVSYNLVLGTQRPGGARGQQVKSVEIPFRVLGGVNEHGELLGHDLLSPYIILQDQARVENITCGSTGSHNIAPRQKQKQTKTSKPARSTLDDFLAHVDELLTKPRQNSSLGLLSPTDIPSSRRPSGMEEMLSAKEAIDMAILRSNLTTSLQQSANRFEITRSGQRVAVVMLARPAYRLGETITAVIEFIGAEIPCYALHAALETSEKVDPALALRSNASIHRVTRRIHASQSESTLFAKRISFSPTIPAMATPSFITSGVSLDWRIVIEFVTPRLEGDSESARPSKDLLEEISRDDRGIVLAATEGLNCESFEIAVPLRVYGALPGSVEKDESPQGFLV